MERYDALANVLASPNSHAMGVMKLLKEYYPSFAKKVFQNNPFMEKMVMSSYSSMDILRHPICNRCEALAAYIRYATNPDGTTITKENGKKVGVCKCLRCGSETIDPITFYEWCLMELKKKAPAHIATDLVMVVDEVAEKLMQDAKRVYISTREKERFYDTSVES